jgi:16S rRNA (guanine527-N7)-methyltransferase
VTPHPPRDAGEWARRLATAGLTGELADSLGAYLAILARWSTAVDLLGALDDDEVVGLVWESLAALPWVAATDGLLDVGSGNGFPAVPLLLARPGATGVLLEPRERRWAFLREVVRELALPVEVVRERIAEHRGGPYTVVTVRGVAMGEWLPHAGRLLDRAGTLLWWTGAARAEAFARRVEEGRVITSPLPESGRGCLAAWRRCST